MNIQPSSEKPWLPPECATVVAEVERLLGKTMITPPLKQA